MRAISLQVMIYFSHAATRLWNALFLRKTHNWLTACQVKLSAQFFGIFIWSCLTSPDSRIFHDLWIVSHCLLYPESVFMMSTADRLNGFVVGITDLDPQSTPPVPGQYNVCAQSTGNLAAGATVNIVCGTHPGRAVCHHTAAESWNTDPLRSGRLRMLQRLEFYGHEPITVVQNRQCIFKNNTNYTQLQHACIWDWK